MDPLYAPLPDDLELRAQRAFLRRLARGLLGDDAAAEDVVQEAELRALERGPAQPESVRTWLATVTRRLALNVRRANERRAAREQSVARAEAQPGPDEALEGLDLQRAVLEAVRALDEPHRTVLWQRYYEDRSPGEIAERLGLPLATVKTRLRRGLERLRRALDEQSGGRREAWAVGLVVLARNGRTGAAAATVAALAGVLAMKTLMMVCALTVLAALVWRGRTSPPASAPEADVSLAFDPPAPVIESSPEQAPMEAVREGVALPDAKESFSADVGGTLDLGVFWDDDTAAAGVGFTLWPEDDPLADLHALEFQTDDDGHARIDGLPAGCHALYGDRGTQAKVWLEAGKELGMKLYIPLGVDVLGSVVDGTGQPVGGAEVWGESAPHRSGSVGGSVVAITGADGSFRLRSLGSDQMLGAFAPGYAPAFLERLQLLAPVAGEHELRVTLVLDREGYTLAGCVLDHEGRPVDRARVAIGTKGNVVADHWRPRARLLWTDAEGRFEAPWLESEVPAGGVQVLAADHALARVEFPEEDAELVVHLGVGVTIEGVVTDADGEPVSGADVTVFRAGGIEPESSPFRLPRVRTGEDGSYRLEHVPAGQVELTAGVGNTTGRQPAGASGTRELTDGALVRWDFELVRSPTITGHVLDPEGNPVPGRPVIVNSERRIVTGVVSDANGAFTFTPDEPDAEWSLAVYGGNEVLDQRDHVRVGDDVVLVAREHHGRILGGFTDRAGLAREGERLRVWREAESDLLPLAESSLDAQGAFAFEGVAPGRYRVTIVSGERPLVTGTWFDLAEDQTVDLGWLETQ